jgi:oligosaccharyltransferase complex subunit epsilon
MAKKSTSSETKVAQQQQPPILMQLWSSYRRETSTRLQLIDAYMVFLLLTGLIQLVHLVLAGTYPYNAFLAGFSATVGAFVFAAALRVQTNPKNPEAQRVLPERALADFIFCNLVLFLAVVNFIG